ncbi:MAG: hypothetical protein KGJ57_18295 [Sphingomonadales bacterium]|nr:hypothetical protein [Sphingomonadales bacterium]MDE2171350.1 hypothetical protein [Sphingomonadales bacterium]
MSKDGIDKKAVDHYYGLMTGLRDAQRYERDWANFHEKAQAGINRAAANWWANHQTK